VAKLAISVGQVEHNVNATHWQKAILDITKTIVETIFKHCVGMN
jgi:hypothetical protein